MTDSVQSVRERPLPSFTNAALRLETALILLKGAGGNRQAMQTIASTVGLQTDVYGAASAHVHMANLLAQCRLIRSQWESQRTQRDDLEARDEEDWAASLQAISSAIAFLLIHPGIDFAQARGQFADVDLARLRALGQWMTRDEPFVKPSDIAELRGAVDALRSAVLSANVPPTIRAVLREILERLLRGLEEFASRGWSAMRECLLAVADEVDRHEDALREGVDVDTRAALVSACTILRRIGVVLGHGADLTALFDRFVYPTLLGSGQ